MRRHDRECCEQSFFTDLLDRADVMTLAFHAGEFPYVIPVNFVYMNSAVYVHCATEGRKLDCLMKNPGTGFSVHEVLGIDREQATTRYLSLYGEGRAALVEDDEEKQAALAALAKKYRSRCTLPVPADMLSRTAVIKISIVSMNGKKNLPPERAD